jgi:16S rRNA (cytosine967-C5)-methyltransferase
VFAHDINPKRMQDLPNRADRAGVKVFCLETAELARFAPFDIVIVDAPCSGSGSWRRAPAGKWALSEERLIELSQLQRSILGEVAPLVHPKGLLAYATCSMLHDENALVVENFVSENPEWMATLQRNWRVTDGVDGFFTAHLIR